MLDDDVKQISLGALRQLELDLIQCERMSEYFNLLPFYPPHIKLHTVLISA